MFLTIFFNHWYLCKLGLRWVKYALRNSAKLHMSPMYLYKNALKSAYDNGVDIIPISFKWDRDGNCYYDSKNIPILWD